MHEHEQVKSELRVVVPSLLRHCHDCSIFIQSLMTGLLRMDLFQHLELRAVSRLGRLPFFSSCGNQVKKALRMVVTIDVYRYCSATLSDVISLEMSLRVLLSLRLSVFGLSLWINYDNSNGPSL